MIFQLLLFIFLVIATCIVYIMLRQKYSRFYVLLKKIPGPPAHPVIGNLFTFLSSREKLFEINLDLSNKYYPIYREYGPTYGAVNLLHPDDIELVLSNSKFNDKSDIYEFLQSWLGTGLLTSKSTKWQTRRKILTPAFHFSILQDFVPVFNEETRKLVEEVKSQCKLGAVDVVEPVTQFTLLSIAETSMGIKLDATPQNCYAYKDAIRTFGNTFTYRLMRPWIHNDTLFDLTEVGKASKKAIDTLHDFSRNIINERKKNIVVENTKPKKALLDLLLSAQTKGADIDDEGIGEEVDTFMFEGHDTTSLAITYALVLLANNLSVQKEIYEEVTAVLGDPFNPPTYNDLKDMTFLERCLKECLRLYPSVPIISRMITEDIRTSSGYLIPTGAMANIHIYGLHRNPEFYPNPLKFDPDRFLPENTKGRHPFAYLPFSAGPRNCIGQKYAMLEMKAVICGIVANFFLEPDDKPQDIHMVADLVLRSKEDVIRIKFKPRNTF